MKMEELICCVLHGEACGSGVEWVKRVAKESPELTPEDHWRGGTRSGYMMWLATYAGIAAADLREGVIAALKHRVQWRLTTSQLLSLLNHEVAARWPESIDRAQVRAVQEIEERDGWDELDQYDLDLPGDILAAHWPWESIEAKLLSKLSDDDWHQFRSAMRLDAEMRSLGFRMPDNEYYLHVGDVLQQLSYSQVLRVTLHLNPYLSTGELRELVKNDIEECREMKEHERAEGQQLLAAQDVLGWEGPLSNDTLCEYLQAHSAASRFKFKRAVAKAWQRKMKLETKKENEHGDEH